MGSVTSSLIYLLATLSLAHADASYGPHPQPEPRSIRRAQDGKGPLGGRAVANVVNASGEGGEGKVLWYPLKQEALNETVVRRRRRLVKEVVSEGSLGKRQSRWTWKHMDDFRGYLYTMEVEVGDPPQAVRLTPDTGSWETWVNPKCESAASVPLCEMNGFYQPANSKLATTNNEPFAFGYGSGFATGMYYVDRIYFRDEDVGITQKFGVALDSGYAVSGILGLGYGSAYNINYNNIVDSLVSHSIINGPIYSVALAPIGAGTSEIVFGGVNLARYSGYLKPVPVWPPVDEQPENWVHFWVNLTSVTITAPSGKLLPIYAAGRNTKPINALVDTGVTYSYLPPAVVDALAVAFGAYREVNEWKVDCAVRDMAGTVNFGFGDDLVVHVPYSDFFLWLQDNTCTLGAQKREEEDDSMLGDTFLRGAYVVYDQMTNNLWMADYKDCGSQVAEVGRTPGDPGKCQGLDDAA
ncbi:uncharacterized protein DNG_06298 [Cephalotrichum gorgonifer]|uniref:Peptidase A1 domain-containing protein n=1 Tax=Cephalotrichum gorgonifer TaxID=2041049 RepID=A0AAE8SWA9_9PEZI|nr:uncharacterized protein DNG_06298 [Cephalotrichum gorgonifer]